MEINEVIACISNIAEARLEHCTRLLELAHMQNSILAGGDHSGLADNVAQFDSLLVEINKLDRREETLMRYLNQHKNRFHELCPQYRVLADQTTRSLQKLKEITEQNKHLLNNAMGFVNFSMSIIAQIATGGPVHQGVNNRSSITLDMRA